MNNEITLEDLSYELDLMLQATLFYAGVKKSNLAKACDIYVENIDEILTNSNSQGVDEIIEVIEYLKKHHKDLFE